MAEILKPGEFNLDDFDVEILSPDEIDLKDFDIETPSAIKEQILTQEEVAPGLEAVLQDQNLTFSQRQELRRRFGLKEEALPETVAALLPRTAKEETRQKLDAPLPEQEDIPVEARKEIAIGVSPQEPAGIALAEEEDFKQTKEQRKATRTAFAFTKDLSDLPFRVLRGGVRSFNENDVFLQEEIADTKKGIVGAIGSEIVNPFNYTGGLILKGMVKVGGPLARVATAIRQAIAKPEIGKKDALRILREQGAIRTGKAGVLPKLKRSLAVMGEAGVSNIIPGTIEIGEALNRSEAESVSNALGVGVATVGAPFIDMLLRGGGEGLKRFIASVKGMSSNEFEIQLRQGIGALKPQEATIKEGAKLPSTISDGVISADKVIREQMINPTSDKLTQLLSDAPELNTIGLFEELQKIVRLRVETSEEEIGRAGASIELDKLFKAGAGTPGKTSASAELLVDFKRIFDRGIDYIAPEASKAIAQKTKEKTLKEFRRTIDNFLRNTTGDFGRKYSQLNDEMSKVYENLNKVMLGVKSKAPIKMNIEAEKLAEKLVNNSDKDFRTGEFAKAFEQFTENNQIALNAKLIQLKNQLAKATGEQKSLLKKEITQTRKTIADSDFLNDSFQTRIAEKFQARFSGESRKTIGEIFQDMLAFPIDITIASTAKIRKIAKIPTSVRNIRNAWVRRGTEEFFIRRRIGQLEDELTKTENNVSKQQAKATPAGQAGVLRAQAKLDVIQNQLDDLIDVQIPIVGAIDEAAGSAKEFVGEKFEQIKGFGEGLGKAAKFFNPVNGTLKTDSRNQNP